MKHSTFLKIYVYALFTSLLILKSVEKPWLLKFWPLAYTSLLAVQLLFVASIALSFASPLKILSSQKWYWGPLPPSRHLPSSLKLYSICLLGNKQTLKTRILAY